ncbi:MAG: NADH-quinone oxidoreductase subunit J [Ekhidna sp.]
MIVFIILLLLILMGVGIILSTKNVIHAAYALALVLIAIAGVYVLLNAELLAVVQILLYAGGVVILLVFGVMMTNRLRGEKLISESKNVVLGGIISSVFFVVLCYLISNHFFSLSGIESEGDQVKQIGVSFLIEHIVAFELIAFALLVALVGAAYLAKMSRDE